MSEARYCFYCDAYRERFRCETCGNNTRSMKTPTSSELPPAWRPSDQKGVSDGPLP